MTNNKGGLERKVEGYKRPYIEIRLISGSEEEAREDKRKEKDLLYEISIMRWEDGKYIPLISYRTENEHATDLKSAAGFRSNGHQDSYMRYLTSKRLERGLTKKVGEYFANLYNGDSGRKVFGVDTFRQRGFKLQDIEIPDTIYQTFTLDGDQITQQSQLLTKKQERALFERFNYYKYQTRRIGILLNNGEVDDIESALEDIAKLQEELSRTRNDLVSYNMPLVLSMAKNSKVFLPFDVLISEGSMALLRAIEGFDHTRGFKFSTYAYPTINQSFTRAAIKEGKHFKIEGSSYDPDLESGTYAEDKMDENVDFYSELLQRILGKNSARLDERENYIITRRVLFCEYGLDRRPTLQELGDEYGISKERVRQIQNRAFKKLRRALDEERDLRTTIFV
ncbi:MAG: sigma-70 family RNA polymerase sigma factor [Nanoarchaeota archaeon]